MKGDLQTAFFLCGEGILMWEVHTLGKLPYERLSNQEIVDQVSRGHRLYRPQLANERVYSIMNSCWPEVSDHNQSINNQSHDSSCPTTYGC